MSTPQKPNVDYNDPADKPPLEKSDGLPLDSVVLGRDPTSTMLRIILAIVIFVFGFGTLFYFLNQ